MTDGVDDLGIPPLFFRLVDDTSLLRPRAVRPAVDDVVEHYLQSRGGRYGGLVGSLVCPVSALPALVGSLAKAGPQHPVDLSLVVDTGLGAVPKALSTVLSRAALVAPRTVETTAPPDVDDVWLERVSEFVPEDVVAVVEPRRPQPGDDRGTRAWLEAVRRVADHGCTPKLRCGGPRASDVPNITDVEDFVRVIAEAKRPFTALGLSEVVRTPGEPTRHGLLNLIVAVARALDGGAVGEALAEVDAARLAAEAAALSDDGVTAVRGLLSRCAADPDPVPADRLAGLGLLPTP